MNTGHATALMADLSGGATGAQPAVTFQPGPKVQAVVHVDLGSTGTVSIEGRLDPNATFRALGAQSPTAGTFAATITASGIYILPVSCSEMRANVTANGSTVKVWVAA